MFWFNLNARVLMFLNVLTGCNSKERDVMRDGAALVKLGLQVEPRRAVVEQSQNKTKRTAKLQ